MAKRGRPPVENKPERITRSVSFPGDLNEDLKKIAAREERDVTSQIVKALRDFVARYKQENGEELGPMELAQLAA
jgi:hypothetical protein